MSNKSLGGSASIKTKDYARIKNFLKCDKLVGGFPYLENGSYINDPNWTEISEHGGGINSTANATLPLVGDGWQALEVGVDILFMCAYKLNVSVAIVNFGFGDTGAGSQGPNFHMGGAVTGAAAIVGVDGTHGQSETVTKQMGTNQYVRWCWKGTYGERWDYSLTTEGTPVNFVGGDGLFQNNSVPYTWDNTGAASFGVNNTMFVALDPGDSLSLYGMVAVEFPNGFPDDLDDRINQTFDAWEAGNKTHFPLFADE